MKNNDTDILLTIQQELDSMARETPEMPEDFHAGWMRAVEEEMENHPGTEEKPDTGKTEKSSGSSQWKRILAVAAAAVFLVGGTLLTRDKRPDAAKNASVTAEYGIGTVSGGRTASAKNSAPYPAADSAVMYEEAAEYDAAEEAPAMMAGGSSAPAPAVQPKKIIRTVSLTIGSKTFEDTYEKIRSGCEQYGGWVEQASESTSGSGLRSVSMTLRIPAEHLDDFNDAIAGAGRVIRRSESAADVTENYQDTEGRLRTQKALLERLQSLVTTAASLTELLQLESQIADVQYTIDSLQGSLDGMDRKVNYSAVEIMLREESDEQVKEVKEATFTERIGAALSSGFRRFTVFLSDMAVFLIGALPWLAVIAAVIAVIVVIGRKRKQRRQKRS